MTVRYGEIHKLVRREISKDCTIEIVGAWCNVCNHHRFILIHEDGHARCLRCLSTLDGIPDVDPKKNIRRNWLVRTFRKLFRRGKK